MKKNRHLLALCAAAVVLIGCATPTSIVELNSAEGKFYTQAVDNFNSPDIFLKDTSLDQNINGTYPEHISVKTLSQTFLKDYEFMIRAGKIYYKKYDEGLWQIFMMTGVPPESQYVTEICADGDCLFVFNEKARMFKLYTQKTTISRIFTWVEEFGWPDASPLYQNQLVNTKRGWAMGTRRKDVLWYEDIFGNQHHYGTMGLETIYFLCEDGQHIRFTDSGLPCSFGKTIQNPRDGAFIAQNISCSASTLFLIGDKGTMYTRLIDFDTMGCDPMFFKYTYKQETQKRTGEEYLSNYAPWGLPAEDWKLQPPIPLNGKARLTKYISIHQNGHGNAARELRVAGTDAEGNRGYYAKQIFDEEWQFVRENLALIETDFLKGTAEIGESDEYSFTGCLFAGDTLDERITVSVSDFPLASEGQFTLRFTFNQDGTPFTKDVILFAVEMWTYLPGIDPGRDGTPKFYFITPYSSDEELESGSPELTEFLKKIFKGLDRKTFCMNAEATEKYLHIYWKNKANYTIFLDETGKWRLPQAAKSAYMLMNPVSPLYENENCVLEKRTYTADDLPLIEKTIEKNEEYMKYLRGEISVFKAYRSETNVSRWGYNLADLITTVTLLNQIDFPKIKTLTSFGDQIMETNARRYYEMHEYRKGTYPYILSITELRTEYYKECAARIKETGSARVEEKAAADYSDCFSVAGIKNADGTADTAGRPASLSLFDDAAMFPGFLVTIDYETHTEFIILELDGFAEGIYKRADSDFSKESLANNPLSAKVVFHCYSTQSGQKTFGGIKSLQKKSGILEWNGTELTVTAGSKLFFSCAFPDNLLQ